MRILIIGGKGTIGKSVANHLADSHEIIIGGRSNGDVIVDIADMESLTAMFEKVGEIDAIVCSESDIPEEGWVHFCMIPISGLNKN